MKAEFIYYHCERFRKLTYRALALRHSLTLERSVFQIFHDGHSTFINSFDETKFSCQGQTLSDCPPGCFLLNSELVSSCCPWPFFASIFSAKVALKNRSTIFTLGNRGNVLTTELEEPVIVPHAALKSEKKVTAVYFYIYFSVHRLAPPVSFLRVPANSREGVCERYISVLGGMLYSPQIPSSGSCELHKLWQVITKSSVNGLYSPGLSQCWKHSSCWGCRVYL